MTHLIKLYFQFVELKSMVFKKFEKNNLFHMSCSDVRERFHYIILLMVVIVQTMKEYSWSEKQFWILMPDCAWVLVAEVFVDYFKHAFVTRFNEISGEVYEEYSLSLAFDLVGSKLKSVRIECFKLEDFLIRLTFSPWMNRPFLIIVMWYLAEWGSSHYLFRYLLFESFSAPLALPTTTRAFVCCLPSSGNFLGGNFL